MKAIIMAGGSGTRLWPLSRQKHPKQIQPFFDDQTLLQKTYRRLRRGFKPTDIVVATSTAHVAAVRRQIPELPAQHIMAEPVRRDTAPALALALLRVLKTDPEATVVYVNADNFVADEKEFHRMLGVAERVVAKHPDHLVLLGVRPTYPETGYGYIKMGSQKMKIRRGIRGADEVFAVESFREKPDLKTAERYVASWEYLWNPTLIVARAHTLATRFAHHAPALWRVMEHIRPTLGTAKESAAIATWFPKAPSISIDYALLEKEKKMLVLPADFGWTDVGHWRTIYDILAKKKGANVGRGTVVAIDSTSNLLVSTTGKMIAAVGVEDMILVETGDAILLCKKDRAQDVKKVVAEMMHKKMNRYL